MCYSAQIERNWRKYSRIVGHANAISLRDFARKYFFRIEDSSIKIPKAVDEWFKHPQNDQEREIAESISIYNAQRLAKCEQTVFEQRKRVADAERKLQKKVTKKAQDDVRVGNDKIRDNLRWISDIKRTEIQDKDARIFPGWFVPVIVSENGARTMKLMRYQCRPAGSPKFLDKQLDTFNARRDNLGGKFWKPLFGYSHGIMIANAFFENVETDELGKHVLQFQPRGLEQMYVAVLWSHWQQGDEELDSCAAITDEPPPEVAEAGHDRCIIPIKDENIEGWLNPDASNLDAMQAILDDRARPYYEHRMAA
jgi:putative SOS response-associated peptidase YedK